MRRLAYLTALVLVFAACGPRTDTTVPASQQPPKYTTVLFADGFDGTKLDTTKWSTGKFAGAGITASYNGHETACYDPALVTVNNGQLTLGMRGNSPCNGYPHRGSSITTYGKATIRPPAYIEAEICLDGNSRGIYDWPAWWTVGVPLDYPRRGEIDFMEGLGGRARATYHDSDGTQTFAEMGPQVGCHIYGTWWRDGLLTAFLDGRRFGVTISGIVSDPQILILGAQGSGDIGGDNGFQPVVVKHVAVYGP